MYGAGSGRPQLSTVSGSDRKLLHHQARRRKSLTGKGISGVIVGFPRFSAGRRDDQRRQSARTQKRKNPKAKRLKRANAQERRKNTPRPHEGRQAMLATPFKRSTPSKPHAIFRPAIRWTDHETHLSSLKSSPCPHPRISGSHEKPRRPCCHQRTPRQRPQASGRLRQRHCRGRHLPAVAPVCGHRVAM